MQLLILERKVQLTEKVTFNPHFYYKKIQKKTKTAKMLTNGRK